MIRSQARHRLSAHLHECGQTLKYQCPYCRYQHKVRADIYKHVQKKHKKKEVYAMEIDRNEVKPRAQELKKQSYHTKIGRRKFPCPKCSSTFVHKHDVKKHLTFICGQTPRFKCPYCNNCTKMLFTNLEEFPRDRVICYDEEPNR
ncbi:hypothetical protein HZH66_011155 [Vespula vulgaris]|uniref:C2H2-type domain-containing protein n=1 Tax=Vespula vulgaris TaxID=7454 RepID=A0A834MXH4_VESVU|nr:hypothetical protein HZH66_011155 [Vespula vulgaris]